MNKTTFQISKMDCPAEENIIKMKLNGFTEIAALAFDIPNRLVVIYHSGNHDEILKALDSLDFDTTFIATETSNDVNFNTNSKQQKRVLQQVLFINFFFFVLELLTGFLSHSMGLLADGLDMLADSIVYALALFAVGGTVMRKNQIARASGYLQLTLAVLGFIEVIRRFMGFGDLPKFQTMIIISIFALIGNAACLYLLQKSKSDENHIKASMIFTSNDVIVNLGVILAGTLVYLTHSKIPDLIVGILVFILVGKGAFRIFKLSHN
ncbi:cation transporter [Flavobacterium lacustre]|uniref:cation transporter n=1 Tax=Flavobacterium lacustre TaxID=3016339 RepID=UPI0022B5E631|nr:cation transporter [Flavobacterium lacustre]